MMEDTLHFCVGCNCFEAQACDDGGKPCSWLRTDDVLNLGVCSACAGYLRRWDETNHETLDPAVRFADVVKVAQGLGLKLYRYSAGGQLLGYEFSDEYQVGGLPVDAELTVEPAEVFDPALDTCGVILRIFETPIDALRSVVGTQQREHLVLGEAADATALLMLLPDPEQMIGVVDFRKSLIVVPA